MLLLNMESKNIEITYPITKYYQLIIFFSILTIVFLFVSLIFFLLFITKSEGRIENLLQMLLAVLITFIHLNISFWFLFGKETIIIGNNLVTIIKTNRILNIKKNFNRKNFVVAKKNYRFLDQNLPKNWMEQRIEKIREKQRIIPFWYEMGKIDIITKNKDFSIFNGLPLIEIDMITKEINDALQPKNS